MSLSELRLVARVNHFLAFPFAKAGLVVNDFAELRLADISTNLGTDS